MTILFLISCSKEDNYQIQELKISSTTVKASIVSDAEPGLFAYPNPFHDLVYLYLVGKTPADILISDDKGDFKRISASDNQIILDFSNEKSGVYDCEILSNNIVYRIYLIKE